MRTTILTVLTAALVAIVSAGAAAKSPVDKCSNLKGIQHAIPAGYKRGAALKCVKKPKPKPPTCSAGFALGTDGQCHEIAPPTPANVAWWPSGYTGWTGNGTNSYVKGQSLVAYAPASCNTIGGGQLQNGQRDPNGYICWAYTMLVNVQFTNGSTGCKTLYVSANEISGGVIVGYTNALLSNIPNNQPALAQRNVYSAGRSDLSLQLTQIDCFS